VAVFSLVPVSSCSKSSFFPPCSMKQQEEQTVTRCNTLMMIYSTIGFQGLAATSILAFILPAWMQLWQKKKKKPTNIFFFFFSLSKASTCGITSCSQLGKKKMPHCASDHGWPFGYFLIFLLLGSYWDEVVFL